jgi:hypothetical protein
MVFGGCRSKMAGPAVESASACSQRVRPFGRPLGSPLSVAFFRVNLPQGI